MPYNPVAERLLGLGLVPQAELVPVALQDWAGCRQSLAAVGRPVDTPEGPANTGSCTSHHCKYSHNEIALSSPEARRG
jgi:hypothetical protein